MINKVSENNVSMHGWYGYLARATDRKITTRPYRYMEFQRKNNPPQPSFLSNMWNALKQTLKDMVGSFNN